MDDGSRRYVTVILATEAANLSSALLHIREGRTDRATELLEQALDRCVMCMEHLLKDAQPADLRNLTNALEAVRSYRRRYPQERAAGK
jgi:hypothetical protein